MNYIHGCCRTNLDGYNRYGWPNRFAKVPEKGDYVESTDRQKVLKVCGITHTLVKDFVDEDGFKYPIMPFIIVELNKCF